MLIALSLLFHHWLGAARLNLILHNPYVCLYINCVCTFSVFCFHFIFAVHSAGCCSYCQQPLLFLLFYAICVSWFILVSVLFLFFFLFCLTACHHHKNGPIAQLFYHMCLAISSIAWLECAWICEYSYVFMYRAFSFSVVPCVVYVRACVVHYSFDEY